MPSSSTSAFSKPEDYQAALEPCGIREVIVPNGSQFSARLTLIHLNEIYLLAVTEHAARLAVVSVPSPHALITFVMKGSSSNVWGDLEARPTDLVTLSGVQHTYWRTLGPVRWGAIYLTGTMLAEHGQAVIDSPLPILTPGLTWWRPPSRALLQFLSLHGAAIRQTVRQPEAPIRTEAARGLKQEIIASLTECLALGNGSTIRLRTEQQAELAEHLDQIIATSSKPLLITDLARQLNVSPATLRAYCRRCLGMSARDYIRLRRVQRIQANDKPHPYSH